MERAWGRIFRREGEEASRTMGWVVAPSLRWTITGARRGKLEVRAGQAKWNCPASNAMGAPGVAEGKLGVGGASCG